MRIVSCDLEIDYVVVSVDFTRPPRSLPKDASAATDLARALLASPPLSKREGRLFKAQLRTALALHCTVEHADESEPWPPCADGMPATDEQDTS